MGEWGRRLGKERETKVERGRGGGVKSEGQRWKRERGERGREGGTPCTVIK